MTSHAAAKRLMELYPRVFIACHRRHVRDERTGRTLSAHQVSILEHLDDIEPTGMTELAGHMGVTPGTMSLAIDRLEQGGYVRRTRDRQDRRKLNVRLTPAGTRVRRNNSVLDPALVVSLVLRLSPPQRAIAIEGLTLLAAAAHEHPTIRSGATGEIE